MKNFGENLKEIRSKNGLSQKEVAERLGISRQAYAQFEKASSPPKAHTINRLAAAFRCSPYDLIPMPVNRKRVNTYYAKLVKQFRIKNNLTIDQLAQKLNISPEEIINLESGAKLISGVELQKFREVLNIPDFDLLLDNSYGLHTNVPDFATLSSFSFPANPLMPVNYQVYSDESQNTFFIEYPDGFVLQLSFNDFAPFAEEISKYGAYCLDRLRKEHNNKS